ncbi:hypothetical protein SDC9_195469 [bioreactor metagenome]|uniref:Uncharacterized protein n=1 Tax=bioreactor metagenome TaxID=1076179 RepID=A0A645I945_9ZZZZ
MVEHEAEAIHLVFGDLGGGMFTAQRQVMQYRREGNDGTLLSGIYPHEDHHGNKHPLHLLLAVAPLPYFLLHRQEVLDARLREPVAYPLFVVHLHIGCQPSFFCCHLLQKYMNFDLFSNRYNEKLFFAKNPDISCSKTPAFLVVRI